MNSVRSDDFMKASFVSSGKEASGTSNQYVVVTTLKLCYDSVNDSCFAGSMHTSKGETK